MDDNHIRVQAEGGLELETRLTRVWTVDGTWGLSALQHVIEPRATWTEIRGLNQKDNPQYDPAIDDLGKASEVTYSLTQRLNAKTVAGPNQEPVRWEAARFVLTQTYNLLPAADQPFKDLKAELILRPNEMFGFRGDAQWNFYGLGLRAATADVIGTYKDAHRRAGRALQRHPHRRPPGHAHRAAQLEVPHRQWRDRGPDHLLPQRARLEPLGRC